MSINKPVFYSGLAVAVLATSASGIICTQIEQTKTSLSGAFDLLDEKKEEADKIIASSSDPTIPQSEKAKCYAQKTSCDTKINSEVGPRVGNIIEKTFQECYDLFSPFTQEYAYEKCTGTVSRLTIAPLLPLAKEHAKCIKDTANCYSNIKKN